MSRGPDPEKWNSWWSGSSKSEPRKNPWVKEVGKTYNKLTESAREYRHQQMNGVGHDPYKDSAERVTGHQAQYADATSAMAGVASTHNTKLFDIDPLAHAASNVKVDAQTGVTSLSDDIYGKLDYGPEGRTFSQMAVGLAGSVMDQFQTLGEANSYNPFGYSANGFGNTNGVLAGMTQTGISSSQAARTDQFGNIIRTEGMQDYVEEGGRRYNLDFAGTRTETDAFGYALPQTGYASTDTSGLYGSAGGGFFGLSGAESTSDALYGYSSTSGSSFGSNPAHALYGDSSTFYGTSTDTSATSASGFYGTSGISSTGSSFYGYTPPTGGSYGTPDPVSSFYGYTAPSSTSGWGGSTDTSASSGSTFWGTAPTTTSDTSGSGWGAPTPAATGWGDATPSTSGGTTPSSSSSDWFFKDTSKDR